MPSTRQYVLIDTIATGLFCDCINYSTVVWPVSRPLRLNITRAPAIYGGCWRSHLMPIQLAFQDVKLRGVCESPVSAKRRLGKAAGMALFARLADLRAAKCPQDLVDLGFAKFSPISKSRIFIPLEDGYFIVIAANHRAALDALGKPDWMRVDRVKIISIERTDES